MAIPANAPLPFTTQNICGFDKDTAFNGCNHLSSYCNLHLQQKLWAWFYNFADYYHYNTITRILCRFIKVSSNVIDITTRITSVIETPIWGLMIVFSSCLVSLKCIIWDIPVILLKTPYEFIFQSYSKKQIDRTCGKYDIRYTSETSLKINSL